MDELKDLKEQVQRLMSKVENLEQKLYKAREAVERHEKCYHKDTLDQADFHRRHGFPY